ncbi:MAG: hypothetical protein KF723_01920 [Rhizobiaceae bacterium]|nr:hypothetical protein [Rhizobiaceae bacterium]
MLRLFRRRKYTADERLGHYEAVLMHRRLASRRQLVPLIEDMVKRRWLAGLIVIAISIVSVVAKGIAAGLIFVYISSLERGAPIALYGYKYHPTGAFSELIVASLVAGVMVLFSSVVDYFVRYVVTTVSMRYVKDQVRVASDILARIPRYERWERLNPGEGALKSIFIGDVRYAAAAYSSLLATVLPALTFAFSLGAIFYLSPALGMIAAVGLFGLAPLYYRLFDYGHDLQSRLRDSGRDHSLDQAALVTSIMRNPIHEWGKGDDVELWMSQNATVEYLRLLALRQSLAERSSLVAAGGVALATAGFVFYVGEQVAQSGTSFAGLATLMLVLRYLVTSFNGIVSRVTGIHAMMPLFGRYMALRSAFELLEKGGVERVDPSSSPDGFETAKWRRLVIYSSRDVSRGDVDRLARRFDPEAKADQVAFVNSQLSPYRWDWTHDLTGGLWDLPTSVESFVETFPAFSSRQKDFAALLEAMKAEPMSLKALKLVPRTLKLVFALKAQIHLRKTLFVLRGEDWDALNVPDRLGVLGLLGENRVIVLYSKFTRAVELPLTDGVYLDTKEGVERLADSVLTDQQITYVRAQLQRNKQGDQTEDPELMELMNG